MSNPNNKRVLIVDGFSTGRELLRELLMLNIECLHLHSSPDPAASDYDAGLYDADLGYLGDADAASDVVAELDPMNIVPGSVSGVELAARLSAVLGLPSNDASRIPDRRMALGALRSARERRPARPSMRHYILNTVSRHERHYVTGAWRVVYLPESYGGGVGALVLLDPSAPRAASLIASASAECSRLGISNGPGHSLLAWSRQGVAPLGAAACLMDIAMDRKPYGAAVMLTQAGVYAKDLATPDFSWGDAFAIRTYKPARHIAKLLFGFEKDCQIESIAGLAKLDLLPSFFGLYRFPKVGDRLNRTTGWEVQAGVVYLVHDDFRQIMVDMIQFRRWERQSALYSVRPC